MLRSTAPPIPPQVYVSMTIEDFENAASIVSQPLPATVSQSIQWEVQGSASVCLRPFNIAETWMANASRQQGGVCADWLGTGITYQGDQLARNKDCIDQGGRLQASVFRSTTCRRLSSLVLQPKSICLGLGLACLDVFPSLTGTERGEN